MKFNEFINIYFTHKLKVVGFKKKGLSFFKEYNDSIALINFQKSTRSVYNNVHFTVNFGIISKRIAAFKNLDLKTPKTYDCHWLIRLSEPPTYLNEKWLDLNDNVDVDTLFTEIMDEIGGRVLPLFEKLSTFEGLVQEWEAGNSPSLTEIQRLINLSILYKESNSIVKLKNTVLKLEEISSGQSTQFLVQDHFSLLNIESIL